MNELTAQPAAPELRTWRLDYQRTAPVIRPTSVEVQTHATDTSRQNGVTHTQPALQRAEGHRSVS